MSVLSQRALGKRLASIPSARLNFTSHPPRLLTVRHQTTGPTQPSSFTAARPAVAGATTPSYGAARPTVAGTTTPSYGAAKPPAVNAGQSIRNTGLNDAPDLILDEGSGVHKVDWARSFHGLSIEPFPKEVADVLLAPADPEDIEIKPDGIIYLPEIKYRRILNKAFGPGGWGLAPRGETIVTEKTVTREYALVCHGRLVSVSRGEQDYFDPSGIPTATEGCKSNALMRTCKDLGIVSELWDPRFIKSFKKKYCDEKFVENQVTKKKKKHWLKKGDAVDYPNKLI